MTVHKSVNVYGLRHMVLNNNNIQIENTSTQYTVELILTDEVVIPFMKKLWFHSDLLSSFLWNDGDPLAGVTCLKCCLSHAIRQDEQWCIHLLCCEEPERFWGVKDTPILKFCPHIWHMYGTQNFWRDRTRGTNIFHFKICMTYFHLN